MPSAALPMARLYQDRDGFSHSIIFSCVSCVSWFKYSQTSCPFVSIRVHSCPFVVQIFPVFVVHSCPFVSIRVHSWFKYSQISCPFVSIRGSGIPSFRVHSCPFVVQIFPDFVSIRGPDQRDFVKKSGFWRDGTFFPEYIKSAMDPRGFSSKTATLQQG